MNSSNSVGGTIPSSSQQSNSVPPLETNSHHNQHLGLNMIDTFVRHNIIPLSNQVQAYQQQHQRLSHHLPQRQDNIRERQQQSQINQFGDEISNEHVSLNLNNYINNWNGQEYQQSQQHNHEGEQINYSSRDNDGDNSPPGGNLAHCA